MSISSGRSVGNRSNRRASGVSPNYAGGVSSEPDDGVHSIPQKPMDDLSDTTSIYSTDDVIIIEDPNPKRRRGRRKRDEDDDSYRPPGYTAKPTATRSSMNEESRRHARVFKQSHNAHQVARAKQYRIQDLRFQWISRQKTLRRQQTILSTRRFPYIDVKNLSLVKHMMAYPPLVTDVLQNTVLLLHRCLQINQNGSHSSTPTGFHSNDVSPLITQLFIYLERSIGATYTPAMTYGTNHTRSGDSHPNQLIHTLVERLFSLDKLLYPLTASLTSGDSSPYFSLDKLTAGLHESFHPQIDSTSTPGGEIVHIHQQRRQEANVELHQVHESPARLLGTEEHEHNPDQPQSLPPSPFIDDTISFDHPTFHMDDILNEYISKQTTTRIIGNHELYVPVHSRIEAEIHRKHLYPTLDMLSEQFKRQLQVRYAYLQSAYEDGRTKLPPVNPDDVYTLINRKSEDYDDINRSITTASTISHAATADIDTTLDEVLLYQQCFYDVYLPGTYHLAPPQAVSGSNPSRGNSTKTNKGSAPSSSSSASSSDVMTPFPIVNIAPVVTLQTSYDEYATFFLDRSPFQKFMFTNSHYHEQFPSDPFSLQSFPVMYEFLFPVNVTLVADSTTNTTVSSADGGEATSIILAGFVATQFTYGSITSHPFRASVVTDNDSTSVGPCYYVYFPDTDMVGYFPLQLCAPYSPGAATHACPRALFDSPHQYHGLTSPPVRSLLYPKLNGDPSHQLPQQQPSPRVLADWLCFFWQLRKSTREDAKIMLHQSILHEQQYQVYYGTKMEFSTLNQNHSLQLLVAQRAHLFIKLYNNCQWHHSKKHGRAFKSNPGSPSLFPNPLSSSSLSSCSTCSSDQRPSSADQAGHSPSPMSASALIQSQTSSLFNNIDPTNIHIHASLLRKARSLRMLLKAHHSLKLASDLLLDEIGHIRPTLGFLLPGNIEAIIHHVIEQSTAAAGLSSHGEPRAMGDHESEPEPPRSDDVRITFTQFKRELVGEHQNVVLYSDILSSLDPPLAQPDSSAGPDSRPDSSADPDSRPDSSADPDSRPDSSADPDSRPDSSADDQDKLQQPSPRITSLHRLLSILSFATLQFGDQLLTLSRSQWAEIVSTVHSSTPSAPQSSLGEDYSNITDKMDSAVAPKKKQAKSKKQTSSKSVEEQQSSVDSISATGGTPTHSDDEFTNTHQNAILSLVSNTNLIHLPMTLQPLVVYTALLIYFTLHQQSDIQTIFNHLASSRKRSKAASSKATSTGCQKTKGSKRGALHHIHSKSHDVSTELTSTFLNFSPLGIINQFVAVLHPTFHVWMVGTVKQFNIQTRKYFIEFVAPATRGYSRMAMNAKKSGRSKRISIVDQSSLVDDDLLHLTMNDATQLIYGWFDPFTHHMCLVTDDIADIFLHTPVQLPPTSASLAKDTHQLQPQPQSGATLPEQLLNQPSRLSRHKIKDQVKRLRNSTKFDDFHDPVPDLCDSDYEEELDTKHVVESFEKFEEKPQVSPFTHDEHMNLYTTSTEHATAIEADNMPSTMTSVFSASAPTNGSMISAAAIGSVGLDDSEFHPTHELYRADQFKQATFQQLSKAEIARLKAMYRTRYSRTSESCRNCSPQSSHAADPTGLHLNPILSASSKSSLFQSGNLQLSLLLKSPAALRKLLKRIIRQHSAMMKSLANASMSQRVGEILMYANQRDGKAIQNRNQMFRNIRCTRCGSVSHENCFKTFLHRSLIVQSYLHKMNLTQHESLCSSMTERISDFFYELSSGVDPTQLAFIPNPQAGVALEELATKGPLPPPPAFPSVDPALLADEQHQVIEINSSDDDDGDGDDDDDDISNEFTPSRGVRFRHDNDDDDDGSSISKRSKARTEKRTTRAQQATTREMLLSDKVQYYDPFVFYDQLSNDIRVMGDRIRNYPPPHTISRRFTPSKSEEILQCQASWVNKPHKFAHENHISIPQAQYARCEPCMACEHCQLLDDYEQFVTCEVCELKVHLSCAEKTLGYRQWLLRRHHQEDLIGRHFTDINEDTGEIMNYQSSVLSAINATAAVGPESLAYPPAVVNNSDKGWTCLNCFKCRDCHIPAAEHVEYNPTTIPTVFPPYVYLLQQQLLREMELHIDGFDHNSISENSIPLVAHQSQSKSSSVSAMESEPQPNAAMLEYPLSPPVLSIHKNAPNQAKLRHWLTLFRQLTYPLDDDHPIPLLYGVAPPPTSPAGHATFNPEDLPSAQRLRQMLQSHREFGTSYSFFPNAYMNELHAYVFASQKYCPFPSDAEQSHMEAFLSMDKNHTINNSPNDDSMQAMSQEGDGSSNPSQSQSQSQSQSSEGEETPSLSDFFDTPQYVYRKHLANTPTMLDFHRFNQEMMSTRFGTHIANTKSVILSDYFLQKNLIVHHLNYSTHNTIFHQGLNLGAYTKQISSIVASSPGYRRDSFPSPISIFHHRRRIAFYSSIFYLPRVKKPVDMYTILESIANDIFSRHMLTQLTLAISGKKNQQPDFPMLLGAISNLRHHFSNGMQSLLETPFYKPAFGDDGQLAGLACTSDLQLKSLSLDLRGKHHVLHFPQPSVLAKIRKQFSHVRPAASPTVDDSNSEVVVRSSKFLHRHYILPAAPLSSLVNNPRRFNAPLMLQAMLLHGALPSPFVLERVFYHTTNPIMTPLINHEFTSSPHLRELVPQNYPKILHVREQKVTITKQENEFYSEHTLGSFMFPLMCAMLPSISQSQMYSRPTYILHTDAIEDHEIGRLKLLAPKSNDTVIDFKHLYHNHDISFDRDTAPYAMEYYANNPSKVPRSASAHHAAAIASNGEQDDFRYQYLSLRQEQLLYEQRMKQQEDLLYHQLQQRSIRFHYSTIEEKYVYASTFPVYPTFLSHVPDTAQTMVSGGARSMDYRGLLQLHSQTTSRQSQHKTIPVYMPLPLEYRSLSLLTQCMGPSQRKSTKAASSQLSDFITVVHGGFLNPHPHDNKNRQEEQLFSSLFTITVPDLLLNLVSRRSYITDSDLPSPVSCFPHYTYLSPPLQLQPAAKEQSESLLLIPNYASILDVDKEKLAKPNQDGTAGLYYIPTIRDETGDSDLLQEPNPLMSPISSLVNINTLVDCDEENDDVTDLTIPVHLSSDTWSKLFTINITETYAALAFTQADKTIQRHGALIMFRPASDNLSISEIKPARTEDSHVPMGYKMLPPHLLGVTTKVYQENVHRSLQSLLLSPSLTLIDQLVRRLRHSRPYASLSGNHHTSLKARTRGYMRVHVDPDNIPSSFIARPSQNEKTPTKPKVDARKHNMADDDGDEDVDQSDANSDDDDDDADTLPPIQFSDSFYKSTMTEQLLVLKQRNRAFWDLLFTDFSSQDAAILSPSHDCLRPPPFPQNIEHALHPSYTPMHSQLDATIPPAHCASAGPVDDYLVPITHHILGTVKMNTVSSESSDCNHYHSNIGDHLFHQRSHVQQNLYKMTLPQMETQELVNGSHLVVANHISSPYQNLNLFLLLVYLAPAPPPPPQPSVNPFLVDLSHLIHSGCDTEQFDVLSHFANMDDDNEQLVASVRLKDVAKPTQKKTGAAKASTRLLIAGGMQLATAAVARKQSSAIPVIKVHGISPTSRKSTRKHSQRMTLGKKSEKSGSTSPAEPSPIDDSFTTTKEVDLADIKFSSIFDTPSIPLSKPTQMVYIPSFFGPIPTMMQSIQDMSQTLRDKHEKEKEKEKGSTTASDHHRSTNTKTSSSAAVSLGLFETESTVVSQFINRLFSPWMPLSSIFSRTRTLAQTPTTMDTYGKLSLHTTHVHWFTQQAYLHQNHYTSGAVHPSHIHGYSGLLCGSCSGQQAKDHACPVCSYVWFTDSTDPMIECASCERWVHAHCVSMDSEDLDMASKDNVTFMCLECVHRRHAQLLLEFVDVLSKYDPHNFFAEDVTDEIAPEYSVTIKVPMSFATIRRKIIELRYEHIDNFKHDLNLIWRNATEYNQSDTLPYKSAKRLQHAAMVLFKLIDNVKLRTVDDFHGKLMNSATDDLLKQTNLAEIEVDDIVPTTAVAPTSSASCSHLQSCSNSQPHQHDRRQQGEDVPQPPKSKYNYDISHVNEHAVPLQASYSLSIAQLVRLALPIGLRGTTFVDLSNILMHNTELLILTPFFVRVLISLLDPMQRRSPFVRLNATQHPMIPKDTIELLKSASLTFVRKTSSHAGVYQPFRVTSSSSASLSKTHQHEGPLLTFNDTVSLLPNDRVYSAYLDSCSPYGAKRPSNLRLPPLEQSLWVASHNEWSQHIEENILPQLTQDQHSNSYTALHIQFLHTLTERYLARRWSHPALAVLDDNDKKLVSYTNSNSVNAQSTASIRLQCSLCQSSDEQESILHCEGCGLAAHSFCYRPGYLLPSSLPVLQIDPPTDGKDVKEEGHGNTDATTEGSSEQKLKQVQPVDHKDGNVITITERDRAMYQKHINIHTRLHKDPLVHPPKPESFYCDACTACACCHERISHPGSSMLSPTPAQLDPQWLHSLFMQYNTQSKVTIMDSKGTVHRTTPYTGGHTSIDRYSDGSYNPGHLLLRLLDTLQPGLELMSQLPQYTGQPLPLPCDTQPGSHISNPLSNKDSILHIDEASPELNEPSVIQPSNQTNSTSTSLLRCSMCFNPSHLHCVPRWLLTQLLCHWSDPSSTHRYVCVDCLVCNSCQSTIHDNRLHHLSPQQVEVIETVLESRFTSLDIKTVLKFRTQVPFVGNVEYPWASRFTTNPLLPSSKALETRCPFCSLLDHPVDPKSLWPNRLDPQISQLVSKFFNPVGPLTRAAPQPPRLSLHHSILLFYRMSSIMSSPSSLSGIPDPVRFEIVPTSLHSTEGHGGEYWDCIHDDMIDMCRNFASPDSQLVNQPSQGKSEENSSTAVEHHHHHRSTASDEQVMCIFCRHLEPGSSCKTWGDSGFPTLPPPFVHQPPRTLSDAFLVPGNTESQTILGRLIPLGHLPSLYCHPLLTSYAMHVDPGNPAATTAQCHELFRQLLHLLVQHHAFWLPSSDQIADVPDTMLTTELYGHEQCLLWASRTTNNVTSLPFDILHQLFKVPRLTPFTFPHSYRPIPAAYEYLSYSMDHTEPVQYDHQVQLKISDIANTLLTACAQLCSFCHKPGATVTCHAHSTSTDSDAVVPCEMAYHLPCALQAGAVLSLVIPPRLIQTTASMTCQLPAEIVPHLPQYMLRYVPSIGYDLSGMTRTVICQNHSKVSSYSFSKTHLNVPLSAHLSQSAAVALRQDFMQDPQFNQSDLETYDELCRQIYNQCFTNTTSLSLPQALSGCLPIPIHIDSKIGCLPPSSYAHLFELVGSNYITNNPLDVSKSLLIHPSHYIDVRLQANIESPDQSTHTHEDDKAAAHSPPPSTQDDPIVYYNSSHHLVIDNPFHIPHVQLEVSPTVLAPPIYNSSIKTQFNTHPSSLLFNIFDTLLDHSAQGLHTATSDEGKPGYTTPWDTFFPFHKMLSTVANTSNEPTLTCLAQLAATVPYPLREDATDATMGISTTPSNPPLLSQLYLSPYKSNSSLVSYLTQTQNSVFASFQSELEKLDHGQQYIHKQQHQAAFIFPRQKLRIGDTTIHYIGQLQPLLEPFHSHALLIPFGYTATRILPHPITKVPFECMFTVTMTKDEDHHRHTQQVLNDVMRCVNLDSSAPHRVYEQPTHDEQPTDDEPHDHDHIPSGYDIIPLVQQIRELLIEQICLSFRHHYHTFASSRAHQQFLELSKKDLSESEPIDNGDDFEYDFDFSPAHLLETPNQSRPAPILDQTTLPQSIRPLDLVPATFLEDRDCTTRLNVLREQLLALGCVVTINIHKLDLSSIYFLIFHLPLLLSADPQHFYTFLDGNPHSFTNGILRGYVSKLISVTLTPLARYVPYYSLTDMTTHSLSLSSTSPLALSESFYQLSIGSSPEHVQYPPLLDFVDMFKLSHPLIQSMLGATPRARVCLKYTSPWSDSLKSAHTIVTSPASSTLQRSWYRCLAYLSPVATFNGRLSVSFKRYLLALSFKLSESHLSGLRWTSLWLQDDPVTATASSLFVMIDEFNRRYTSPQLEPPQGLSQKEGTGAEGDALNAVMIGETDTIHQSLGAVDQTDQIDQGGHKPDDNTIQIKEEDTDTPSDVQIHKPYCLSPQYPEPPIFHEFYSSQFRREFPCYCRALPVDSVTQESQACRTIDSYKLRAKRQYETRTAALLQVLGRYDTTDTTGAGPHQHTITSQSHETSPPEATKDGDAPQPPPQDCPVVHHCLSDVRKPEYHMAARLAPVYLFKNRSVAQMGLNRYVGSKTYIPQLVTHGFYHELCHFIPIPDFRITADRAVFDYNRHTQQHLASFALLPFSTQQWSSLLSLYTNGYAVTRGNIEILLSQPSLHPDDQQLLLQLQQRALFEQFQLTSITTHIILTFCNFHFSLVNSMRHGRISRTLVDVFSGRLNINLFSQVDLSDLCNFQQLIPSTHFVSALSSMATATGFVNPPLVGSALISHDYNRAVLTFTRDYLAQFNFQNYIPSQINAGRGATHSRQFKSKTLSMMTSDGLPLVKIGPGSGRRKLPPIEPFSVDRDDETNICSFSVGNSTLHIDMRMIDADDLFDTQHPNLIKRARYKSSHRNQMLETAIVHLAGNKGFELSQATTTTTTATTSSLTPHIPHSIHQTECACEERFPLITPEQLAPYTSNVVIKLILSAPGEAPDPPLPFGSARSKTVTASPNPRLGEPMPSDIMVAPSSICPSKLSIIDPTTLLITPQATTKLANELIAFCQRELTMPDSTYTNTDQMAELYGVDEDDVHNDPNAKNRYLALSHEPFYLRPIAGHSHIHMWGLFACQDYLPHQFIIEYQGELISRLVSDTRERRYEALNIDSCYMFGVHHNLIVDSTQKGNASRFINHSCDPNCYTKIIDNKIIIIAKTFIPIGTELTYDYCFSSEEQQLECHCGSAKCTGRLN